jgi:hypothetical protein
MRMRPRAILLAAFAVAFTVFCAVQDRVTAAGARQYVAMQRAALARGAQPVVIDEILRPAVARSVWQGLFWSGAVMTAGAVIALAARDRKRR